MDSQTLQKWRDAMNNYSDAKNEYQKIFKSDPTVDFSRQVYSDISGGDSLKYKENFIGFFVISTIIHFILSLSISDVHFFSIGWFVFYIVLSILGVIGVEYKSKKKKALRNSIKEKIDNSIELIEKLYYSLDLDNLVSSFNANDLKMLDSYMQDQSSRKNYLSLLSDKIENTNITSSQIKNLADSHFNNSNSSSNQIRDAASSLFGNSSKWEIED